MDVRQVRPTDAPLVLALALDENAQLVTGPAPNARPLILRTMAHATVPLALPGRTWIARDGATTGLLEAQPRQYVLGWDVVRLAVHGDPHRVLAPLMQAATAHLQSRGVPRLFARCRPEQSAYLSALDFMSLAREYVLLGPGGHVRTDTHLHVDSRYRMPQDAWPLHQLESDTTPALVRQLEGLTSSDWSHKSKDMSEVVVEQDGRIVAWIGWGARRQHGTVELAMLVHPDYKDLANNLVAHALDRAPSHTRFVARVRDYRVETMRALTDMGFQIVGEETVMVKHAGVEVVQEERPTLRLGRVPSIQGVNTQLH
ncbi:MAG: hypothetical protein NVS2B16_16020 [Chloroflexota bacterium]